MLEGFFIEIPTHYLSSRESFVTFDEVHHIDIINKRVSMKNQQVV
jgi:hypothetical protein